MTRKWIASLMMGATLLVAVQVSSYEKTLCEGFLPKNNLKIPVGRFSTGGITQAQFNQVMDRIQRLFEGDVKAAGGTLQINRLWTDATVNASATQSGGVWTLNMYGGLARHPATTIEGMALVACHELGHHLGGAPKISGWGSEWASNEGEADYFATLKCLRTYFAEDDNRTILASTSLDPLIKSTCEKQYTDEKDQLVCGRMSLGGLSVARLFQALTKDPTPPMYSTPDTSQVTYTNDDHPETQCRLDTYFAGMSCAVSVGAKLSATDYREGSCYTPRDTIGFRPRCWFNPDSPSQSDDGE